MEELSGGGSHRPSGGADEREEKVVAKGVVQERWLRQRSLERQIQKKKDIYSEKRRRKEKREEVF